MSGGWMKYTPGLGNYYQRSKERKAEHEKDDQAAATAAAATAAKNETERMTAYEAAKKRLLTKTPVPSTGAGTSLLKG